MKPLLHVLTLKNFPIFRQLQIEEALLRADRENWCILNEGSPPAIVMGISGKPELLVDSEKFKAKPLPLIRRFSGGGTVIVDEETFFATWICNTDAHQISCCPKKILTWTAEVYRPILDQPHFQALENDYTLGDRKFGGNAQYLCKERWLHHTSLLWDYNPNHMDYLLLPPKMPAYREKRTHEQFLCRLKDYFPNKAVLKARFTQELSRHFVVREETDIEEILARPHRKATQFVDY